MNDYETMKQMLTEAGITFESEGSTDYYNNLDLRCQYYIEVANGNLLNGKQFGYSGFVSIWLFDENGKLITTGAYE